MIARVFTHFFDYPWYGDCVAPHSATLVDLYTPRLSSLPIVCAMPVLLTRSAFVNAIEAMEDRMQRIDGVGMAQA